GEQEGQIVDGDALQDLRWRLVEGMSPLEEQPHDLPVAGRREPGDRLCAPSRRGRGESAEQGGQGSSHIMPCSELTQRVTLEACGGALDGRDQFWATPWCADLDAVGQRHLRELLHGERRRWRRQSAGRWVAGGLRVEPCERELRELRIHGVDERGDG